MPGIMAFKTRDTTNDIDLDDSSKIQKLEPTKPKINPMKIESEGYLKH